VSRRMSEPSVHQLQEVLRAVIRFQMIKRSICACPNLGQAEVGAANLLVAELFLVEHAAGFVSLALPQFSRRLSHCEACRGDCNGDGACCRYVAGHELRHRETEDLGLGFLRITSTHAEDVERSFAERNPSSGLHGSAIALHETVVRLALIDPN
jgi:hypothetical protein